LLERSGFDQNVRVEIERGRTLESNRQGNSGFLKIIVATSQS